jgi:nucleotide-binding universal stress UspA family protein
MSESFKTIIIGTTLTETSDGVVRAGVAVARATGASPWLIHVYLPPAFAPELGMGDGRWLEQHDEALREALARQARRTGLADLAGFKPEQLLPLVGSPPRELAAMARQEMADLLVVGAAEGGGLHRIFLGSTADGVIRRASCPVLAVRSGVAFPPVRVEMPVDLSAVGAGAFQKGLSFLSEMGVSLAETEVLFVLNPFEVAGSLHFTPEQIERFAGEEMRAFIAAHSAGRAPRLARIRTGYPREEIVDVLKQRQVDLAILGTHGRGGLQRLALGSVAAEVMHQAACNLLLIPCQAGAEAEEVPREEPRKIADWIFVSDETSVGSAPAMA